jgi:hypothetical protein
MTAAISTGQCGKGWHGIQRHCKRNLAGMAHEVGHQGTHLAENVVSWKVGKIIGAAIGAAAANHGHEAQSITLLAETGVQAATATLLSIRDKGNRSKQSIATKFIAESAAAFAGKMAHGGSENAIESIGLSAQFATIGAMAAGKGVGLTTNIAANRSGIAANLAKRLLGNRTDSADNVATGKLGLTAEEMLTCTIAGAVIALEGRSMRTDSRYLVWFKGRTTSVLVNARNRGAAITKARSKANRGGNGPVVEVRLPTAAENKQISAGRWVLTRPKGKEGMRSRFWG